MAIKTIFVFLESERVVKPCSVWKIRLKIAIASEFVDLHRRVPRSRRSAGHFRILNFLVKNLEEQGRKMEETLLNNTFIGR